MAQSPRDDEEKPPTVPSGETSHTRILIGRDLVALAFLIVLCTFVVAVAFLDTAADIVAVVAPITTLVGTLIGTIFGVQVANQGRAAEASAQAESTRKIAGAAVAAASLAPADMAPQLIRQVNAALSIGNPAETDF